MEKILRSNWVEAFSEISKLMIENKDSLTDIDAKFGDGDHGSTIEKIAKGIKSEIDKWGASDLPLKNFFDSIGNATTNVNGGSAGPLYGTYFSGLGEDLTDEVEVDASLLKMILKSGLTELQYITKAKVGDKTMMDTLIPATLASQEANDTIEDIVTKAKDAAIKGAKDSENYVSKFGRARTYGDKTIGTPDAGAQSCALIFIGLFNALNK